MDVVKIQSNRSNILMSFGTSLLAYISAELNNSGNLELLEDLLTQRQKEFYEAKDEELSICSSFKTLNDIKANILDAVLNMIPKSERQTEYFKMFLEMLKDLKIIFEGDSSLSSEVVLSSKTKGKISL